MVKGKLAKRRNRYVFNIPPLKDGIQQKLQMCLEDTSINRI
jgi:hypothetical protein